MDEQIPESLDEAVATWKSQGIIDGINRAETRRLQDEIDYASNRGDYRKARELFTQWESLAFSLLDDQADRSDL